METFATLTLGEIVRHNHEAATIFEKFGLDFCCRGHQELADACIANGTELTTVIEELLQIQDEKKDPEYCDDWPLDLLVDYICRRHHTYVEEKTPVINANLDKIVLVHGPNHPELREVRDIFFEIGGELIVHMKKEELMLFPYIKKLELAKSPGIAESATVFSSVEEQIEMMRDDHAIEGEKFARIAALTSNYQLPADACNTYAFAFQLLKEYERDLHLHIHLENNILFPKAVGLTKKLNSPNF